MLISEQPSVYLTKVLQYFIVGRAGRVHAHASSRVECDTQPVKLRAEMHAEGVVGVSAPKCYTISLWEGVVGISARG